MFCPSQSPPSSSSSHSASASASRTSFVTLFHLVPASAVCAFLRTADVLSASSADRATRRLLLSPALWRTKVFKSFPPPQSSPLSSSASLPSWCDAVQVVDAQGDPVASDPQSDVDWHTTVAGLAQYPNLRRFHTKDRQFAQHGGGRVPSPSLSSLRHLTRVSIHMGALTLEELRALATLPVLASFHAVGLSFDSGSEDTLRQWAVLTGSTLRLASDEDDDGGEAVGPEAYVWWEEQDPNDPSLPQQHSALLLFLHALAAKPSFVHLELLSCGLTPFVLDHMPVWPHLLSLGVTHNRDLYRYRFEHAARCFPSLTSLTSPNCSDAAIANLVRLPALEELRFACYLTTESSGGTVLTTPRGFRAFSRAPKLRSLYYSPPRGMEEVMPSLASLTSVLTLAYLTRITINAAWPIDGLLSHHFEHLRCLELIRQQFSGGHFCPQTDAVLLPLVKPVDAVVAGREQRQAARAVKRPVDELIAAWDADDPGRAARDDSTAQGVDAAVIPASNAANFPALECLALPYDYYGRRAHCGNVSTWMVAQLRRSYEYEVAAEWEAECTTLGVAELLKAIMA